MKTLKLDNSYKPIEIIDSIAAFSLVYRKKAKIVEGYNTQIHSSNHSWTEPAVIVLDRYVDFKFFRVGCTRRNIYERDKHTCQYCQNTFQASKLTLDHVIPKSKGGQKSWENLVTSCKKCNQFKGSKHLSDTGMELSRQPVKPRYRLLDYLGPAVPGLWKNYLAGAYTW
tara:strand:- start:1822 stop:2328 length:507 start_codon:yes stop_codon:yes gene_type:complete